MSNRRSIRDHARRDRLMLEGLPLLRPIAGRYARSCAVGVDDLSQVGALGLATAAERYSTSAGVPFRSFAKPHIRGAILHYLRDQSHLVRLPRRAGESQQPGTKAVPTGEQQLLLQRWAALSKPLPLELLGPDETPGLAVLGAEAGGPSSGSPWGDYWPADLDQAWQSASARQLLGLVSRRHRQVLRRVVLDGWSYRRTAESLGISAATVQRLLHGGLAQLRECLSQAGPGAAGIRGANQSPRRAASAAQVC